MNALKEGTNALNTLHKQMSVEDVEVLLQESEEAISVSNMRCEYGYCSALIH